MTGSLYFIAKITHLVTFFEKNGASPIIGGSVMESVIATIVLMYIVYRLTK